MALKSKQPFLGGHLGEYLNLTPGHIWNIEAPPMAGFAAEKGIAIASLDFDDRVRLDIWHKSPDTLHWGEFYFKVTEEGVLYYGNRVDFHPCSRLENTFLIPEGILLPSYLGRESPNRGMTYALSAGGARQTIHYTTICAAARNGCFRLRWNVKELFPITLHGKIAYGLTGIKFGDEYWAVTRAY